MPHKSLILRLTLIALAVVLILTVLGSARAQDRRLRIVASFSILADVARNVAGDAADVASLMPLGSNPHAFTPSAQDVVTLSEADMVLVVGAGYEEGLIDVLQGTGGASIRVASDCVPIRPIIGSPPADQSAASDSPAHQDPICDAHHAAVYDALGLQGEPEPDAFLGLLANLACAGDELHAADEDEDDHDHPAGSCDPHVWTDPVNAGLWVLIIRDALVELDPANAEVYAANADAYLAELGALHQDLQALVATVPEERRAIVTNHQAFNYFAARYGLDVVGVVIPGGSTTSEPSVQDVLRLIETVQQAGVPTIFTETTVSENIAQQIAEEAGATIVRLYTGSLSQPGDGADTYLAYMRSNAQAIVEALQ